MNKQSTSKNKAIGQSIYKDSWFLSLSVMTLAVLIFCIAWSLISIKQTEVQIPIRFSSLTNFDRLGNWYQLYEIPIIALVIASANFILASYLHKRNRLISIFIMLSALMCCILATALIIAFTYINYGTI